MKKIKVYLRRLVLKLYWKFKGKSVIYGSKSIINIYSRFEGKNKIGESCVLNDVRLGIGTYMGNNCRFTGTQFGKYTCIANNVKNIIGSHPINQMASVHPAFYSVDGQAGFSYTKTQKYNEYKYLKDDDKIFNLIGNDVWIGEDVLILPNIVIGDGVIIGAGSIVTKDCIPYGIYAGNPAKLIRFRYAEELINRLLYYKWWDKGETWVIKNAVYFEDVNMLLEKLESEV